MPPPTFRGDPYRELGVPADASDESIKRRWRDLAREHHPDRAAKDSSEARRLTRRMARINAAYDLLRDSERRAAYDSRPGTGPGGSSSSRRRDAATFTSRGEACRRGPPPPRPTRPVTARFDTTGIYHSRNATTSATTPNYRRQQPVSTREREFEREPLRASRPNGPVERRPGQDGARTPTLDEARAAELVFGKFRGLTLGEVEASEPTYIDWIARTITRDRDLVICARVIQAGLDERGVERPVRPEASAFGARTEEEAPARSAGAPG
ncbi:MAG: J domain-containing protein [Chloroflexi bacterium]|nr:J domain-containing protein [Chloroflexota bacterium]